MNSINRISSNLVEIHITSFKNTRLLQELTLCGKKLYLYLLVRVRSKPTDSILDELLRQDAITRDEYNQLNTM